MAAPQGGRRADRAWPLAVAAACVCIALLAVWATRAPGGGRLLSRARRMPAAGRDYQWLPTGDVIYTRFGAPGASPVHLRLVKMNVETGAVLPVRAITSKQRNFGLGEWESSLSPDGKALLWIGSDYLLLPLAGSHQQAFPHAQAQIVGGSLPYVPSAAWMPDSGAWMEIRGKSSASALVIHPLSGARAWSVPLPATVGTQRIVGVTPQGEAIITRQRGAVVDGLIAVSLQARPPTVRQLPTSPPPNADVYQVVLSPQGDRLAWTTNTWNDPRTALREWLFARRSNSDPGRGRTRHAVWVSYLDGSGLRELGYEMLPNDGGEQFEAPRWTPDGKGVSFLRGNSLYVVPVP